MRCLCCSNKTQCNTDCNHTVALEHYSAGILPLLSKLLCTRTLMLLNALSDKDVQEHPLNVIMYC